MESGDGAMGIPMRPSVISVAMVRLPNGKLQLIELFLDPKPTLRNIFPLVYTLLSGNAQMSEIGEAGRLPEAFTDRMQVARGAPMTRSRGHAAKGLGFSLNGFRGWLAQLRDKRKHRKHIGRVSYNSIM